MSLWKFHPVHSLAMLIVCGAACAQSVDLKGRVLDKANMLPVAGATVKLNGGSLTAQTGADGRFVLKGSVTALRAHMGSAAEPYLQGGELFVNAAAAGQPVRIELCGLAGQSLFVSDYRAPKAGWNRLSVAAWPKEDFLGFARISTAGVTHVQRILHLSGQARAQFSGELPLPSRALSKSSAGGKVDVTMEKLLPKSVPFTADSADLGDIVLDYPARSKTGLGAEMPYGAYGLFDGSKGKAAALAELQSKWVDWPRFTPSDIKFKIAKDPQYPTDTNRVTLQSCCNSSWGYDDIQAKTVHGDAQLHVEFNCMGKYDTTENPNASDPWNTSGAAGYSNSGVYVQSRYEVQINSWETDTTKIPPTHYMGALVDDASPSKNVNKANGNWQSYDITFREARYDAGGTRLEYGRISMWWNGVLVFDNKEAKAPATGLTNHSGEEMNPTKYGLKLQSEGTDVRFRNIWIKDLVLKEAKTNLGY